MIETHRFLRAGWALTLCAACGRSADSAKPAAAPPSDSSVVTVDSAQQSRFRVQRIDSSLFAPVIGTTGTVEFSADRSTQILAPMSGPVSRLLVIPGAHVAAGEALAAVASPDFAAAVAAYRKADAVWRNARQIADLNEQLFANDALARRELDQSRTDLAGAAADREAALQQLKALGVAEDRLKEIEQGKTPASIEAMIRSPIAGTVVERLITPGQLLQAGATPTFTVADLSTVWVMANVFERDIRGVHRGEQAIVTTDATADSLPGIVDYVADLVDPATKATGVRLVVPNKGGILKRDMLVQVEIRAGSRRKGLLVPVAAVLRDDENLPYLYVAKGGTSFARRRIELGSRIGDRYEVTSGLTAGEPVVVDGALYLGAAGHQ